VFLDVTDIVDYNLTLLNRNSLEQSFFCLDRTDPTIGFLFDATKIAGHSYPETSTYEDVVPHDANERTLWHRLVAASHLAQHLRKQLEGEKGYTSTVGISTNKLLSKLVGNLHKVGDSCLYLLNMVVSLCLM
jgi:DNA polymerase iota